MTAPPDWWTAGPFVTGDDPAERRLRRHAGLVLQAALAAVDPAPLVARSLAAGGLLASDPPVRLLAVGKAASGMARGALPVLGTRVAGGMIVRVAHAAHDLSGTPVSDQLTVIDAGHPLPDAASVFAGRRALRMVRACRPDELLLCLLSGGGSALLALPPDGVRLDDLRATTALLLRAGAPIADVNAIRKHTDLVKGGRLAREAACPVIVLAMSDVIGDDPAVIASGPFSPDLTTFADAIAVLCRHHIWKKTPRRVRAYLEAGLRGEAFDSPKPGDPCFARVDYRVIASARTAADGARAAAHALGYQTAVLTASLSGEARVAGRRLAALARALRGGGPCCIIAAGESTVTVKGDGMGGRNQELAVAAALELDGLPAALLASLGTDGVDGPTDAAGAVVSGSTLARAATSSLDARAALARNDTYPFLASLDDLIRTGPTGTNAMDLQVLLIGTD